MNSLIKKTLSCFLAFSVAASGTYADAGILFGPGGLFQTMRANRLARVSARISARNEAYENYHYVRSYGSSGSVNSYGSSGASNSYGSSGAAGSYGSNGGITTYQYRSVPIIKQSAKDCYINEFGEKVCPLGSVKVNHCTCDENGLCICGENCECENCARNTEQVASLLNAAAPEIFEKTALVGKQAPNIVNSSVASL